MNPCKAFEQSLTAKAIRDAQARSVVRRLIAGEIGKPQNCSYCKKPAVKGYIWADGRAYIPVCEDHRDKVKKQIEVTNEDEITAVRDIPQKKTKSAGLEKLMNPRTAFEQALKLGGEGKEAKWSKKFHQLTYWTSHNTETTVECDDFSKAKKIVEKSKVPQKLKKKASSPRAAFEEALGVQQDSWLTIQDVAEICPPCAQKMASMGMARIQATDLLGQGPEKTAATKIETKGKYPHVEFVVGDFHFQCDEDAVLVTKDTRTSIMSINHYSYKGKGKKEPGQSRPTFDADCERAEEAAWGMAQKQSRA